MPDEPDDFDDAEMQTECPYCDDGWNYIMTANGEERLAVECAECGGTGWY